uniref:Uncharacterized protein n=1 Tax=Cacopsylla melanoneura TaxID=428564 RepID=A0A8D8UUT6_9HEMI
MTLPPPLPPSLVRTKPPRPFHNYTVTKVVPEIIQVPTIIMQVSLAVLPTTTIVRVPIVIAVIVRRRHGACQRLRRCRRNTVLVKRRVIRRLGNSRARERTMG